MTSSQFVRAKRLSKKNHIAVAAKHNLRELQAERGADSHIDVRRIHRNRVLLGERTASAINEHANRLMTEAGVLPLRKNAMRAIELLVSLPNGTKINIDQYFEHTLRWVNEFFGIPILSAVIHLDESAPHMHVLMLPLRDNKMQGDKILGDRLHMQEMQESFYTGVARSYGLSRRPSSYSKIERQKSASLLYTAIVDEPALLLKPEVELAVMNAFTKNPAPILDSIGIRMPHRPKRTFTEIMTKPCKPEPRSGDYRHTLEHAEISNPYVSVGFPTSH